jgi:cysteinyl-tRNA synthetase
LIEESGRGKSVLKLYNSLGKRVEPFWPVDDSRVTIFTCGPSVYQRAHIGNFRTFLFEDVLVRYLAYLGYTVKRGMNFTDIEDKAIREAKKRHTSVRDLTDGNIREFMEDMNLLGMKIPDYLPRASEAIDEAVAIMDCLLDRQIAYRHGRNIYFDPLKSPDFGKLYGLDLTKWPAKKRRFHQDTYPGIQWNLGDFILWHGCKQGDPVCWDTKIGKGRPSWNIQDPSMVSKHFRETLSIYCGGYDNLFRHHDYTRAILESIRPYPMARYWLHCHHLHVNGKRMSKTRGNIVYTDTLLEQGFDSREIRFFLIYSHYRKKLRYTRQTMQSAADRLRKFRQVVRLIQNRANQTTEFTGGMAQTIKRTFTEKMDNDLDVKDAFDWLYGLLARIEPGDVRPGEASTLIKVLGEIDNVLGVIF